MSQFYQALLCTWGCQRLNCRYRHIRTGTSHGAYKFKGDPELDFARLEKISNMLPDFPLVLHGASTVLPEFVSKCNEFGGEIMGAKGVPEEMLLQAGKLGVCKINIDTDLRLAMTASIREHLVNNPGDFDPRQYLKNLLELQFKIWFSIRLKMF